jgi:transposase InsO family protein
MMHRELLARGVKVSENTVARVMRKHHIRSKTSRKFRVTTTDSNHGHPIAPNRLKQEFNPPAPNQVWCTDITAIETDEGHLYLATVMDLFSRKIVGWSMQDHMKATLCIEALEMAIQHRRPEEGLILHSDQGVQFACYDYQATLDRHGLLSSMSRKGNCYDNAAMESFYSTLKKESIYQNHFATRADAHAEIFEFIEVFYNRVRRHSTLGYVSPVAFEAAIN